VGSLRWWLCDRDGRVVLGQIPNPALAVWLASLVVGWTGVLGADRAETLTGVGQGALVVWALDELLRGSSPVRRLLGAVVLAMLLVGLFA
jgi:multisubunit Na+/H+ antiporter MnhE subunit